MIMSAADARNKAHHSREARSREVEKYINFRISQAVQEGKRETTIEGVIIEQSIINKLVELGYEVYGFKPLYTIRWGKT